MKRKILSAVRSSPAIVYGGEVCLIMAWLRLVLLAVTTLVSGINMFDK